MWTTITSHKKILISGIGIFYFMIIILVNQAGGGAVALMWDAAIIMTAIAGAFCCNFAIDTKRIFLIILVVLTGAVNYKFIGNATVNSQILIVLYIIASMLFTSRYFDEKAAYAMILMNALVIMAKFAAVGVSGQVFINSSTNFVSVFLLYPAIVYYVLLDYRGKRIPLSPAVLIWILSLLARGRGGIIATTFFLVGISAVTFDQNAGKIKLLLFIGILIAVFLVILNYQTIVQKLNGSVITEYFRDRGMQSSRGWIWSQYFERLKGNWKTILFGANTRGTYANLYLQNNFHNSFITIHQNNGLFPLIYVVIEAVNCIRKSVSGKKWMYLICLLTMLLRGFTDNVFWTAYGTPVFFFLLFFLHDTWPASQRLSGQ